MLDEHRANSPSLSPIGGATPDLIASCIMPAIENSSIAQAQSQSMPAEAMPQVQAFSGDDSVDLDKEEEQERGEPVQNGDVALATSGKHEAVMVDAVQNPEESKDGNAPLDGSGDAEDEAVKDIVLDLTKSSAVDQQ